MSETFSILIDSRSRFETGQPGGEWLSMPTTTEQLHAAMKSVGITAENPQDFFINGFANTESYPFDVPLSVVQGSTIDELNYLGKLLEMQGDDDRDKFTAAVTLGEHAGSVKDLINLAQNLDCYWIYPTVRTEADYGYYLIDELDELELPEEAKKYFKYEEYGRDAVQKDRGQFTEQGYIYNNRNTFSQWYNGRENDIPKEYKVMSFPEPERPTPDKVEKDEAAPEQEAAQQEAQPGESPPPRPVNPIILTADKPAEKIKEITDRLEQGITELFDSERYKEYLQVMSKFHNYSFNNTLLIAMQKPDASLIAGFNAWKNNFGRNVMRGEKGIRILAPSPYKIRQEVEKKDPQTGKTVIGSDGKPVTETKEIQIPAYKVVAVFDVSQTEGRELPSIGANELTGNVEQYEDFYTALEKTSPVPMGFEKIEGGAHGYCHLEEKRIAIDEGMSQLQNLKTAIHEIAHAKLHDIDLNAPEQPDRPDRRTREVQAESIAYTAIQAYVAECRGLINQGEYNLPPVPQLKDFDVELQAYKEHVKEEIAQEAAAAGMTVEEYAANGYEPYAAPEPETAQTTETPEPEKADTPAQEGAAAEKADTPEQAAQTADKPLTEIQKKAVEIAEKYENLPLQEKIGIIAQAFGGTEGKIETSPCTGKWRGTSDISIKFDNGASLFIGNHRTPQAKTARVQNECVNAALVRYNPEIIAATKEAAIAALRARETKDNEIAVQKGLKPYTLLNVEFNDGTDEKSSGHMGWYYVTLAVGGEIHSHIETGLNYAISDGKVSEMPTRENYFAAGALKESDVDYVFNNVGFSSTSDLYSLPISEEVRKHAEKTLAERNGAQTEKAADPQSHAAEPTETKVTYYPINENAARRAKQAISYSDYKPGSATAEYRHYVDEAAEIAARQKKRVDPSFHEKIDGLLDAYARKLAANMNKGYEITARVPSILIAGGSNFPVRKKEKQNAAADKNMEEYREIQGLLDKIRSTGMGGISADDPNAVSKLESKLAKLEQAQETMKAVNAYYRKNKTLDGCPHLSTEQIEKLKASMSGSYRANPKPFESYQLSNNNAEIHRLKDRITALTRRKELGYVGWEFDGGRVEANTADNRLQIFFDEKPDKEIREELKGNGFRYAPSAEAWQRQLNDNAIYAADRIKCIQPLTGERPTELQKRARQEAAAERTAAPEQPQEEAQGAEPGEAATPETFYKVRQNPYSDSPENSYLLQEYVAQDNGMAKLGDILYKGTPEKCRELLGKLETGELTQGDVKELYAKAQEAQPAAEPGRETPIKEIGLLYGKEDAFGIYQLKDGDGMRDYHFEPYDRLQASGLSVDATNYDLIYTAELTPGTSLEDIYTRFNIDHPKDFKGHSLSVSDIVVLHQNGENTAHYVDSIGYREVPEFLHGQTPQLTPDTRMTGEQIRTPRGSFSVTDMTAEQMREAGYGLHHTSEDGKYLIMGNGTQAFAVAAEQPEKANPLKHVEDTIEQNDNNFDGIINNTPTVDELEAKVTAGEQISLIDLANAVKADKERGKEAKPGKKPEKKPSIRAQLKADKERAAQKKQARSKSQDLERS